MSEKRAKTMLLFSALFLILSGIFLYYIFEKQGYGNKNVNQMLNYNIDDYIETASVLYNNYDDVFSEITVSKIIFKQLDSSLTNEFLARENEIIEYIDKYYIDIKNNGNYDSSNKVVTTIKSQINSAILSIFYKIEFYINGELKNYLVTLNIDLQTNKIVTNNDLLNKYDYSKEYISDKLFNDIVLIGDNEVVVDKDTNISLTKDDIFRKKNQYIKSIVSNFDNIIYMYIENKSLAIAYDNKVLKELFYNTNANSQISIKYLK